MLVIYSLKSGTWTLVLWWYMSFSSEHDSFCGIKSDINFPRSRIISGASCQTLRTHTERTCLLVSLVDFSQSMFSFVSPRSPLILFPWKHTHTHTHTPPPRSRSICCRAPFSWEELGHVPRSEHSRTAWLTTVTRRASTYFARESRLKTCILSTLERWEDVTL